MNKIFFIFATIAVIASATSAAAGVSTKGAAAWTASADRSGAMVAGVMW